MCGSYYCEACWNNSLPRAQQPPPHPMQPLPVPGGRQGVMPNYGGGGFAARDQDLERRLEEMSRQLEALRVFLSTQEFMYELSYPIVPVALEIPGMEDGVEYVLQGLGRDGMWTRLFGQVHRRNEIGLHQFANHAEFRTFRLMCMSRVPMQKPVLKVYQASDDPRSFQRGIPVLTAPSPVQDGYEISSSTQFGATDFSDFSAHTCYNVLDDNVKTQFASVANPGTSWLQVKLPRPRAFNAVEIGARGGSSFDQAPRDFHIEASCDLVHWTKLAPLSTGPWRAGERRVFSFANQQEFLAYRLVISRSQGSQYHAISVLNFGNTARI